VTLREILVETEKLTRSSPRLEGIRIEIGISESVITDRSRPHGFLVKFFGEDKNDDLEQKGTDAAEVADALVSIFDSKATHAETMIMAIGRKK